MKVVVGYPTPTEELEIVTRMGVDPPTPEAVLDATALLELQRAADGIYVDPAVVWYAVSLVFATRAPRDQGFTDLEPLIAYGASPRATLGLVAAGRALALIRGRTYVLPQDVYDIAPEVLRHRLVLSYEALADGVEADHIVNRVITAIQLPRIAPSQERVPGTRAAGLVPGTEPADPSEQTA
jgi:MoxR-like ATPase